MSAACGRRVAVAGARAGAGVIAADADAAREAEQRKTRDDTIFLVILLRRCSEIQVVCDPFPESVVWWGWAATHRSPDGLPARAKPCQYLLDVVCK